MKFLAVLIFSAVAVHSTAQIPQNPSAQRFLSRADWDQTLKEVRDLYAADLQAKGLELIFESHYDSEKKSATAEQLGSRWFVIMNGGYTLSPAITRDVVAKIACHEMGHHLGGTALMNAWITHPWAAVEGQADYYSTLKCLRRYFSKMDNAAHLKTVAVPNDVSEKCASVFTASDKFSICVRSTLAALDWVKVLCPTCQLDLKTPDTYETDVTWDEHPPAQCRLDTLFQGALCAEDMNIETSLIDFRVGTCNEETHAIGLRPKCWYKPIK